MRIINDNFTRGMIPAWDLNCEHESTIKFNREIRAVHLMYAYLDSKGILKHISIRYIGDDTGASFSFDVEVLTPYKEQMLNSGIEDAELAVHLIFDEKRCQCYMCGGIQLGWTMHTYRDWGNVSASRECWICKHLDNKAISEISDKRKTLGSVAAIEYAWDKYYLPQ